MSTLKSVLGVFFVVVRKSLYIDLVKKIVKKTNSFCKICKFKNKKSRLQYEIYYEIARFSFTFQPDICYQITCNNATCKMLNDIVNFTKDVKNCTRNTGYCYVSVKIVFLFYALFISSMPLIYIWYVMR